MSQQISTRKISATIFLVAVLAISAVLFGLNLMSIARQWRLGHARPTVYTMEQALQRGGGMVSGPDQKNPRRAACFIGVVDRKGRTTAQGTKRFGELVDKLKGMYHTGGFVCWESKTKLKGGKRYRIRLIAPSAEMELSRRQGGGGLSIAYVNENNQMAAPPPFDAVIPPR